MPLQFVASRHGQRGRPVSPERIARMLDIVEVVEKQTIAITARHLFYLLTMRPGARLPILKTEAAYDRVCEDLLALRRSGDVAWSAITDGTRIKTRWVGYGSLGEAAEEWQRSYRRDIWRTNPATCEVWTESRGLLGTINEVAGEYGVTTLGVGGFNSATIGWETAQDAKKAAARGQDFYIFHFGDYDPSGRLIGSTAEKHIREHLTQSEQEWFTFEVCALTAEQVRRYDLPTAPPKLDKKTGRPAGGHAKSWDGGVTELDALDPRILQRLVRAEIRSIIDDHALAAVKVAEESERDTLERIAAAMHGSAT